MNYIELAEMPGFARVLGQSMENIIVKITTEIELNIM